MALPTNLALSIMRGDAKTWTFTLEDENGDPLATLEDAWFTAKRRHRDADIDATFQLTLGSGITETTPGTIEVAATTAATDDLPDVRVTLVYDLQVKPTGGAIQTALYGDLTVEPDVTESVA